MTMDILDIPHTSPESPPPEPVVPRLPAYIDSTMVAAFRTCPRLFYNEYILGLRSPGNSWDLHAGSAWAKGMDAARIALLAGAAGEEALHHGMLALTHAYGEEDPPLAKKNKSWFNLAAAFPRYWKHFGYPANCGGTDPLELLGSEYSFSFPLPIKHPETRDPICYVGRVDALTSYNGFVYPLDDKTASQLGDAWTKKWALRGQLFGYAYAMRQHHPLVGGAIVRGSGLYANGVDFLQYQADYALSPWLLNQWYDDLCNTVSRIASLYERIAAYRALSQAPSPGSFPRVWNDACASYGTCTYLPLCQTPDTRQDAKYELYVVNRWDPLAEHG